MSASDVCGGAGSALIGQDPEEEARLRKRRSLELLAVNDSVESAKRWASWEKKKGMRWKSYLAELDYQLYWRGYR